MTQKPITVRDLKTFIEAVEFAADQAEWVPSPRQWAKIRSMINDLEETPAAPTPAAQPIHVERAPPAYQPPPAHYQLAPTVLAAPQPRITPPTQLPAFSNGNNGALRTPDIDTSTGGYTSGFV